MPIHHATAQASSIITLSERCAMSGRIPEPFVLKRKDRTCLLELPRSGQTPLKVARRALILPGRGTGEQSIRLGESHPCDS